MKREKYRWAVFYWGVGLNDGSWREDEGIIAVFELKKDAKAYFEREIKNCAKREPVISWG